MTREEREEEITILQNMEYELSNPVGSTYCRKKYDTVSTVIKPLEKEDIFDKISAEIKGITPTYHNPDWSITDLVPISKVLKLIDKYKAEIEVNNGNDD